MFFLLDCGSSMSKLSFHGFGTTTSGSELAADICCWGTFVSELYTTVLFRKIGFVHCFGDVVSEFAEHRFRGYVPELLLKNISFKNCLLQDIWDDTKTQ